MTRKGLKKKASESEDGSAPKLGPWWLFDDDTAPGFVIKDDDNKLVARVIRKRDARLMASSWRLLETAKMVIERWSSGRLDEAVRELHAAVDSCEGRE